MCRRVLAFVLVSLASAFSPNAYSVTKTTTSPLVAFRMKTWRSRVPCWVANTPLEEPLGGADEISPYTFPESMISSEVTLEKLINGVFLAACFGYAAYVILNIDHAMSRGWTQSEIAMRIPLDNWSSYEAALNEKPVMTKTVINVIIYLLGDWLSQTVFQKKNVLDFDLSRTLRNGFIGLCFGPLVHLYYEFSDTILPVEGGLVNRASKILMDQTIYLTVKCSIYISAVGLLAGDDWPTTQQNVKDRIKPVVFAAWKFWPLVHCITYSLIPAQHRILWVNCVDLVWNAILASKARGDNDESHKEIPHCDEEEQLIESALKDSKESVDVRELALEVPLIEFDLDDTTGSQLPVLDSGELAESLEEIVFDDRPSDANLTSAGLAHAT